MMVLTFKIAGFAVVMTVWSVYKLRIFIAKRKRKEASVYGFLMGLSAIVGCLMIARIEIPSQVAPLARIFQPIGHWLLQR